MIGYSASRGFSATLELFVATVKHFTQWTRHVTRSQNLHWSYGVRTSKAPIDEIPKTSKRLGM